MLGCVAISWKSPLLLQGTACLMNPEKNTAQKRWLPKGRTGPVPKRKELVQRVLHSALGLGLVPQQQTAVGKKAGVQDPENMASESCPGDREQTLRSQTQQSLGLQIALTTDGYTCLLSVWSLVTVLSNLQKCCLLPASITTVLSGWNQEYQTFIQTLGATLDLHWNNTNVTEVRLWQWVNRNRNSSISCKGDKEICHELWCDRKSKKVHENRQTQNIFYLFFF